MAGLSSLAIGERKATLRQTNSIMQDIVSFQPMIQSVTSKAEDLQQAAPANEISSKYETLSKTAQELYAKQKVRLVMYFKTKIYVCNLEILSVLRANIAKGFYCNFRNKGMFFIAN